MGRAPCCDKSKVKRGPWSLEEDTLLKEFIHTHGTGGNWISLPRKAGLNRCGKSCRLRWLNYLRPNIRHGGFTPEEDYIICTLYSSIGSRWSLIATKLPGRTDNDVKNYWNTKLKKKIISGKVPGFESGSIFSTTNNCNINIVNSTGLAQIDWTHLTKTNPKPEITAYEYGTSAIPYPTASAVYDPDVKSSRCSSVSWGSSSSSTSVYDQQMGGGSDDQELKEDDIDDFWLGMLVDQSTFMAGSPQGLHDKINELASLLDGPSYGIY